MSEQSLSFDFHKCLGLGGFGEVYLATLVRPGGLSKQVAVKVLKPDLRHAEAAVQRLRDEGRMLAILDHPCILRVLEMTLIQGRVALVTEYIGGIDLARCCKPGRLLPQSVILGALGEVASALHCAWTTPSPETGKPLKLIHRDIKPENIRIGRHGEVKLLDFGIARTTEMFRHAKTAQGDLPFTPGYAAPEAFTKGFQGSASDIYALGVSMFRLLVGERIYESMDLSDQVSICCLNERYAPFLKQRLAKLEAPTAVQQLLRDMLSYEAHDRPSALEVEDRCATIGASLEGPSHIRWARATQFPAAIGLEGGTLTGQKIEEDPLERAKPRKTRGVSLKPRQNDASRGLLDQPDLEQAPRPQAQQAQGSVVDLTPPMGMNLELPPPPPKRPPPMKSTPPTVPAGLQGVRPITASSEHPGRPHSLDPIPAPDPNESNRDRTPANAPSTMGDFSEAPNPTLQPPEPDPTGKSSPTVPAPPTFDGKATLDAWAHTANDEILPPPPPSETGRAAPTYNGPPKTLDKEPVPPTYNGPPPPNFKLSKVPATAPVKFSEAKTVERPIPPPPSTPPVRRPDPITMAPIGGSDIPDPPAPKSRLPMIALALFAMVVVGGGFIAVGVAVGLGLLYLT